MIKILFIRWNNSLAETNFDVGEKEPEHFHRGTGTKKEKSSLAEPNLKFEQKNKAIQTITDIREALWNMIRE